MKRLHMETLHSLSTTDKTATTPTRATSVAAISVAAIWYRSTTATWRNSTTTATSRPRSCYSIKLRRAKIQRSSICCNRECIDRATLSRTLDHHKRRTVLNSRPLS